jgi:hypothetical protein
MNTITFYKDNRIDQEYKVDLTKVIQLYLNSEDSKIEWPFERKFLLFLSNEFKSTFDPFTNKEWDSIYHKHKELTTH